jgi:acetyl-CoA carboxylase biotin carboxyl carrier protein
MPTGAIGPQEECLELEELKEILRVLDERGISEFELEKEGIKLRVRKASAGPPVAVLAPAPAAAVAAVPAPAPQSAASAEAAAASEEESGLTIVRSPIVGTFYRSPAPDAPPFVEVGDTVKPGQVLCIVEAMKLMNEIESEVSGRIAKIHIQNAQPVQYGEILFSIAPA